MDRLLPKDTLSITDKLPPALNFDKIETELPIRVHERMETELPTVAISRALQRVKVTLARIDTALPSLANEDAERLELKEAVSATENLDRRQDLP